MTHSASSASRRELDPDRSNIACEAHSDGQSGAMLPVQLATKGKLLGDVEPMELLGVSMSKRGEFGHGIDVFCGR